MSYFLLPSNPVRPICQSFLAARMLRGKVDLGGIEPPSNSLSWDTLRFFFNASKLTKANISVNNNRETHLLCECPDDQSKHSI